MREPSRAGGGRPGASLWFEWWYRRVPELHLHRHRSERPRSRAAWAVAAGGPRGRGVPRPSRVVDGHPRAEGPVEGAGHWTGAVACLRRSARRACLARRPLPARHGSERSTK